METVRNVEALESNHEWWVPAVVAPERGWAGMAGSHRGSRYLIDVDTLRPGRANYPAFESQAECLSWIMRHRAALTSATPGARVRPARLAQWLLGLE